MKEGRMSIFFDSNVIVDALTGRSRSGASLFLCKQAILGNIKGYIATKQITDIAYVLRKYHFTSGDINSFLSVIMNNFIVLPTLPSDINYVLQNAKMKNFEDAILDEIAHVNCVKFFVTNNVKDFDNSRNVISTPEEIMNLYTGTNDY